jgi:hypothetical protein
MDVHMFHVKFSVIKKAERYYYIDFVSPVLLRYAKTTVTFELSFRTNPQDVVTEGSMAVIKLTFN